MFLELILHFQLISIKIGLLLNYGGLFNAKKQKITQSFNQIE